MNRRFVRTKPIPAEGARLAVIVPAFNKDPSKTPKMPLVRRLGNRLANPIISPIVRQSYYDTVANGTGGR